MYQSLIWLAVLLDEARRLAAPRDPQDMKRLPDPLVDRVGGNPELDRDFLRRQMLRDELQTVELAARQLRHAVRSLWFHILGANAPERGIRHPSHPFKRCLLPRRNARVSGNLRQNGRFGQGQRVIFR
jgi:hypothetical protein